MSRFQVTSASLYLLLGARAPSPHQRAEHTQVLKESHVRATRSMRARAPAFPALSRPATSHCLPTPGEANKINEQILF